MSMLYVFFYISCKALEHVYNLPCLSSIIFPHLASLGLLIPCATSSWPVAPACSAAAAHSAGHVPGCACGHLGAGRGTWQEARPGMLGLWQGQRAFGRGTAGAGSRACGAVRFGQQSCGAGGVQGCRSVSHSPVALLVGAVLAGGGWGPRHWRWCVVAVVPEGLMAVLGWQLSHIADVLTVVGLEALHNIFGDSSPFLQGAEQGERSCHRAQPQPHAAGVSPGQGCLHHLTWKLPLWVMNSSSKFLLGLGIRGIRMTHTLCRRGVSEEKSPSAAAPNQLPTLTFLCASAG